MCAVSLYTDTSALLFLPSCMVICKSLLFCCYLLQRTSSKEIPSLPTNRPLSAGPVPLGSLSDWVWPSTPPLDQKSRVRARYTPNREGLITQCFRCYYMLMYRGEPVSAKYAAVGMHGASICGARYLYWYIWVLTMYVSMSTI